ncbi:MAG: hypothetical protein NWR12_07190 [Haliea sp.]|jgi:hypothetical protein|nr:hypothetical protein [Haliea sp.]
MGSVHSTEQAPGSLRKKWAWFVGLWLAGVLTVGAVSVVLRWVLL